MGISPAPDGSAHLRWIWRFQISLLPLGLLLWMLNSGKSSIIFFVGGAISLFVWQFHKWVVGRMLSPVVRLRWFYAFVGTFKLVLIAFCLRAIIRHFPSEVFPFVTGLLLFVAAIMMEAARLTFRHFRPSGSAGD
jgi:uncharacterized membrane protein